MPHFSSSTHSYSKPGSNLSRTRDVAISARFPSSVGISSQSLESYRQSLVERSIVPFASRTGKLNASTNTSLDIAQPANSVSHRVSAKSSGGVVVPASIVLQFQPGQTQHIVQPVIVQPYNDEPNQVAFSPNRQRQQFRGQQQAEQQYQHQQQQYQQTQYQHQQPQHQRFSEFDRQELLRQTIKDQYASWVNHRDSHEPRPVGPSNGAPIKFNATDMRINSNQRDNATVTDSRSRGYGGSEISDKFSLAALRAQEPSMKSLLAHDAMHSNSNQQNRQLSHSQSASNFAIPPRSQEYQIPVLQANSNPVIVNGNQSTNNILVNPPLIVPEPLINNPSAAFNGNFLQFDEERMQAARRYEHAATQNGRPAKSLVRSASAKKFSSGGVALKKSMFEREKVRAAQRFADEEAALNRLKIRKLEEKNARLQKEMARQRTHSTMPNTARTAAKLAQADAIRAAAIQEQLKPQMNPAQINLQQIHEQIQRAAALTPAAVNYQATIVGQAQQQLNTQNSQRHNAEQQSQVHSSATAAATETAADSVSVARYGFQTAGRKTRPDPTEMKSIFHPPPTPIRSTTGSKYSAAALGFGRKHHEYRNAIGVSNEEKAGIELAIEKNFIQNVKAKLNGNTFESVFGREKEERPATAAPANAAATATASASATAESKRKAESKVSSRVSARGMKSNRPATAVSSRLKGGFSM